MISTATIEREALSPIWSAARQYSVETVEQPDGPRVSTRTHRRLDTTIEVSDGIVYVVMEGDEAVLLPGDSAVVPAGTPYRRWNAGDEDAHFVETYRAVA